MKEFIHPDEGNLFHPYGSGEFKHLPGCLDHRVIDHIPLINDRRTSLLFSFLKGLDEPGRKSLRNELNQKTVDLSSALGRVVRFDEVVPALKRGFEHAWDVKFQDGGEDAGVIAGAQEPAGEEL